VTEGVRVRLVKAELGLMGEERKLESAADAIVELERECKKGVEGYSQMQSQLN